MINGVVKAPTPKIARGQLKRSPKKVHGTTRQNSK